MDHEAFQDEFYKLCKKYGIDESIVSYWVDHLNPETKATVMLNCNLQFATETIHHLMKTIKNRIEEGH